MIRHRSARRWAIWPADSRSRVGPTAQRRCRRPPCRIWPERASASSWKGPPLMNVSYRRFEMFLPRQFNDGRLVPDELFGETLLEIRQRFGAVSSETQFI